MQHRGPGRFTGDFEKSLLSSQLATLVGTSQRPLAIQYINPEMQLGHAVYQHVHCFLDSGDWTAALAASVSFRQEFVDRSPFAITYFIIAMPVANLLLKFVKFIHRTDRETQALQRDALLAEVSEILAKGRLGFERMLKLEPMKAAANTYTAETECDITYLQYRWEKFRDLAQVALLSFDRLYVALGGLGYDKIEAAAQVRAETLLERYSGRQNTYFERTSAIVIASFSRSIVNTADEWTHFTKGNDKDAVVLPGSKRIVSPSFFAKWYRQTGYKGV